MANNTQDEGILEVALQEARAKYQRIDNESNLLSNKVFALLATELAIVTFLFASGSSFLPDQLYGIIFYALGVASVLFAISVLFWGALSNEWEVPAEMKELKKLRFPTKAAFLKYLKDDYLEAYEFCLWQYEKRRRILDWSIFLFVGGATILVVIKFAG